MIGVFDALLHVCIGSKPIDVNQKIDASITYSLWPLKVNILTKM